jgi:hypothetical protein
MNSESQTGVPTEEITVHPGNCFPDIKDKYVYPEIPATASVNEREQLSQLPDKVLKSLSTYALIQSLTDRPSLFMKYLLSSNISHIGTSYIIHAGHNSVAEFETRADRVESLMAYYGFIGFDCFQSLDEIGQSTFSIRLTVVEALFTRDKVLQSLNSAQKKQIVALLLEKYNQKTLNKVGAGGSLDAMAVIMIEDQYPPVTALFDDLGDGWKESLFIDTDHIDDIVTSAENYIR